MRNTIKTIAIIANGEMVDYPLIASLIKQYDRIVAVDGGIEHCRKMGISPDLIIGDLDSATEETLSLYSHIPKQKFPKEKDESDTEIAIKLSLSPEINRITLFAALGKRTDHTLYNLHLLHRFGSKIDIESEFENIFIVKNEMIIPSLPGQTISLIPLFGEATEVTSEGLHWELDKAHFNQSFMSLSNRPLGDQFRLTLKSGCLLCTIQKKLIAS